MNIQSYSFNLKNNHNPAFGRVQTSATKVFSEEQVKLARYIVEEARRFQDSGMTLEQLYSKKGLDLIIDPFEDNLVSLFTCRSNALEGKRVDEFLIYARQGSDFIKIGSYGIKNINQVEGNLIKHLGNK